MVTPGCWQLLLPLPGGQRQGWAQAGGSPSAGVCSLAAAATSLPFASNTNHNLHARHHLSRTCPPCRYAAYMELFDPLCGPSGPSRPLMVGEGNEAAKVGWWEAGRRDAIMPVQGSSSSSSSMVGQGAGGRQRKQSHACAVCGVLLHRWPHEWLASNNAAHKPPSWQRLPGERHWAPASRLACAAA